MTIWYTFIDYILLSKLNDLKRKIEKVAIRIHPHAQERMKERGATENEIINNVEHGEQFPAKFNRSGFRRNYLFEAKWHGKYYSTKQVEAYTVREDNDTVIITVITRFF